MTNENIIFITNTEIDQIVEHVIIEHPDGSTTSMRKTHWDQLQIEKNQNLINNLENDELEII